MCVKNILCKIFDLCDKDDYDNVVNELQIANQKIIGLSYTIKQKDTQILDLKTKLELKDKEIADLKKQLGESGNQNQDKEYIVDFEDNPDIVYYMDDEEVDLKKAPFSFPKNTEIKVFAKAKEPLNQPFVSLYREER